VNSLLKKQRDVLLKNSIVPYKLEAAGHDREKYRIPEDGEGLL
jgi:hypothetical protein